MPRLKNGVSIGAGQELDVADPVALTRLDHDHLPVHRAPASARADAETHATEDVVGVHRGLDPTEPVEHLGSPRAALGRPGRGS